MGPARNLELISVPAGDIESAAPQYSIIEKQTAAQAGKARSAVCLCFGKKNY